MRPGRLTLQFMLVLCLLPIVGLSVAGFLNYLKFERLLISNVAARYDGVLRDLVLAIGNSLEEGLTLDTTRSTEQLIRRSAGQFDGAFDLFVADGEGVLLYTTRPSAEGQDGAGFEGGVTRLEAPAPGDILHTVDPGQEFTARTPILQGGTPVGMLLLSHKGGDVAARLDETSSRLVDALLGSLLPVVPLLVLGTVWVLGRIEGRIEERGETLQEASGPGAPKPASPDPLVQAVWKIGQETAKPGKPA